MNRLTEKTRLVLEQAIAGKSNSVISEKLCLEKEEVKRILNEAYDILNVSNRVQAAIKIRKQESKK